MGGFKGHNNFRSECRPGKWIFNQANQVLSTGCECWRWLYNTQIYRTYEGDWRFKARTCGTLCKLLEHCKSWGLVYFGGLLIKGWWREKRNPPPFPNLCETIEATSFFFTALRVLSCGNLLHSGFYLLNVHLFLTDFPWNPVKLSRTRLMRWPHHPIIQPSGEFDRWRMNPMTRFARKHVLLRGGELINLLGLKWCMRINPLEGHEPRKPCMVTHQHAFFVEWNQRLSQVSSSCGQCFDLEFLQSSQLFFERGGPGGPTGEMVSTTSGILCNTSKVYI